jgi:periplasmic divalent cation tolerance protein
MGEPIFVMVTCATADEAEAIANRLVEERLAACVNIFGRLRSLFHWKGALARETEFLLTVKTCREQFDALNRMVKELHSYEVPEVIGVPIMLGNEDYLDWIRRSTAQRL